MIASRPSLLTDWPHLRPPLEKAVEVGLSADELTRTERDQFAACATPSASPTDRRTKEFKKQTEAMGLRLLRPDRKDETCRAG